ncbi:DUF222 domain-containing protein [Mycolicibacterium pulveris]|uniref:HNH nuclease domain-containing protein n=1 Tax=Mycolicibacterium pulveris TaxID=36813 RepID=A0A7I7UV80_MYCPV|nr:DUF222 domain-containing protein [Mycolicibacterium pulveris]MCV6982389.1 DUF222 domain-containing protein [Mycolicibacterium pulveris]BBY83956.1 hypothetical protein MPUL_51140 [Mycolicibacterium pulveris]
MEIYPDETAGMAILWGTLHSADAAAVDQRLDALADTVCENDPRTKRQRRADACAPAVRGETVVACQCGSAACPAQASRQAAATAVIHVLAEQGTLDATSDTPGYLPGFGVLPAESVRELARSATLKPLHVPTGAAADPGYRPSAASREFIYRRDLTCRWPGCDRPAQRCDVDHTVPWPGGPTHPSNNKCYCRLHDLDKALRDLAAVVAFGSMASTLSFCVEQLSTAEPAVLYDTFLDVESWPGWMPTVSTASWERRGAPVTGVGGIRRVRMNGSDVRDEVTGGSRPSHHTYTTTLPGFWPVKNYRGDIRIDKLPNGSLITWTATFVTPVPGLGKPLRFMLRTLITRLAAALARRAEGGRR